jgi:ATP-dependent Clp protease protease subunit
MTNNEQRPLFDHRLRDRFFGRRVLVLDGVLDDDNGTVLATGLLSLASEDPEKDVALWIHSPGGSVPSMLATPRSAASSPMSPMGISLRPAG